MLADALARGDLAALSIFPLPEAALFPGQLLPLHVFEPRYRALVRDALADSKTLAVARLKPGFEADYDGRPPVFEICGAGRIVEHVEHGDGRFHILLRGLSRVRILEELAPLSPYRVVRAEVVPDLPVDARVGSALEQKLASLWQALAAELPEALRDFAEVTRGADGPGAVSDRLAAVIVGDAETSQALLSEPDPCERLRAITESLERVADSLASGTSGKSQLN